MRFKLCLLLLLSIGSCAQASEAALAGIAINEPMVLPNCPEVSELDAPQVVCLISSSPPDSSGMRHGVFMVAAENPPFIRTRGRIFWFEKAVVLVEVRTVKNSSEADITDFIKKSLNVNKLSHSFDSLPDGPGKGFIWKVPNGQVELHLYSDIDEGTIDLQSDGMPQYTY